MKNDPMVKGKVEKTIGKTFNIKSKLSTFTFNSRHTLVGKM